MASEAKIERVLDLLTKAPAAEVEALRSGARSHTESMRNIIGTKNVVAVGISEKITEGESTGQLALTFYVSRKVPLNKLRADQAIPPTVPESLSGPEAIPTDVVVLGKLRPEVNAKKKIIQPGFSVGHVDITAGTLGAVVQKGDKLCILSNSHVLAVSGTAKKGDSIVYPGPADGGTAPANVIAILTDFKPFVTGGEFVNTADCAIAELTPERQDDVVAEIAGVGLPTGTIKPKRGMKVVKVGRTTGRTEGEIRDVHFRFILSYDEVGEVGYTDQVLCTRYTKPGDSGALVIDLESGRAVGLHFAGSDNKGIFGPTGGSVFNPIEVVLEDLGVKLVTKPIDQPQAEPA